jgi:hypothetical protein
MKTVLPGIKVRRTLAAVAVMVALPLGAAAQEPSADAAPQQPASAADHDDHDLAKKLANPISDLVSIPFRSIGTRGSARTTICASCSPCSRCCRCRSARIGT